MLTFSVVIGMAIGVSLGALGGGGSILTVPALVYLLGQDPHAATTGSLVIVGITALTAMAAHARAGRVRFGPGLAFGVIGVAGSYVGSRWSASVDPAVLLTAFAGLMLVAAAMMTVRRRRGAGPGHDVRDAGHGSRADHGALTGGAGGAARPGAGGVATLEAPIITLTPEFSCACPRALKVVLTATAVGLITGFFGVGGGFVVVPALVLALGFSMPAAVGTSLLVIAVNSAAALLARLGHGVHLDWQVLGVFTVAAVVGSLFGNRVASRVDPARLSAAFTGLLVAVAVYTAGRSVPHLL